MIISFTPAGLLTSLAGIYEITYGYDNYEVVFDNLDGTLTISIDNSFEHEIYFAKFAYDNDE